jgi:hypothetical protein
MGVPYIFTFILFYKILLDTRPISECTPALFNLTIFHADNQLLVVGTTSLDFLGTTVTIGKNDFWT